MAFVIVILGLAATALAGSKSQTIESRNVLSTFNGGFTPTALPRTKPAPIGLNATGRFETKDGSFLPPLRELVVQGDKNAAIATAGFPTCTFSQLQPRDTASARKACRSAIIGAGKAEIDLRLAELPPIPLKSDLTVFNGGVRAGVTVLYIHAYITVPTPTAIVTVVKIKKIHHGPYGLEAVASIPRLLDRSVKSFSLNINKKYTYAGKRMSIFSAKCADGKLQAHVTAVFAFGTRGSLDITRACSATG